MNGAACPERSASSMVSDDGSAETGTQAGGQGLSGFFVAADDKMFCSVLDSSGVEREAASKN